MISAHSRILATLTAMLQQVMDVEENNYRVGWWQQAGRNSGLGTELASKREGNKRRRFLHRLAEGVGAARIEEGSDV